MCIINRVYAGGCTYYISSSEGDDQFDGRSSTTPWKTISRLNQQSLSPGETVCFKRGDVWRLPTDAYLDVKGGSPERGYVTYTAYGFGPKPLFLGSVKKSNPLDWYLTENPNVWTTSDNAFLYDVGNLIFNHYCPLKIESVVSQVLSPWRYCSVYKKASQ
jgi:hypothetical protein